MSPGVTFHAPKSAKEWEKMNPQFGKLESKWTLESLKGNYRGLLQTSSQLEVCMQSYGPQKSWESQLWEFWDSHLGVLGQNVIWMLAPWPGTEYTIRGKVVVSPKSGPW